MKKILIYIVMIIFLLVPISYAKDKNCILKSGSIVANKAVDLVLYDFFIDINEKQLLDYMFKKRRLGTTTKNIEIIILNVITKEDFSVTNIKIKNENIKIWVFYYDIFCEEENDKTKRRTPKGQEEERKIDKERTKRPSIKI